MGYTLDSRWQCRAWTKTIKVKNIRMREKLLVAFVIGLLLIGPLTTYPRTSTRSADTFSRSVRQPDYKNPQLPIGRRVADLVSRMTVEEKVAQLQSMHAGRPKLTD